MTTLTLRSPAKINLYLKVINKRPDGFHNLVTLFERINLFDDLSFVATQTGKIRLFCDHPQMPLGPKNLIYKAARLLQEKHSVDLGVDIKITKRIPIAAGLGGGSSNAATTLLGLKKIWKLFLSSQQLLTYGRALGSDVPFFLHDCSWALGTGRGDQIKVLSLKKRLWHVLVVPCKRLYTRDVFEGLSLPQDGRQRATNILTKKKYNVNILIHHLRKNDILGVSDRLLNDLESSTFSICPRLRILKSRLQKLNTLGVAVSGSGPSIFGLVRSQQEAQGLRSFLSQRYKRVFVVGTF